MFNRLSEHIRMISSCSVDKFKSQLAKLLRRIRIVYFDIITNT